MFLCKEYKDKILLKVAIEVKIKALNFRTIKINAEINREVEVAIFNKYNNF